MLILVSPRSVDVATYQRVAELNAAATHAATLDGFRRALDRQATEALASFGSTEAVQHGLAWLCDRVEDGTWRVASPIGFYFAKLWYYERLYPQIFTVSALNAALDSPRAGSGSLYRHASTS